MLSKRNLRDQFHPSRADPLANRAHGDHLNLFKMFLWGILRQDRDSVSLGGGGGWLILVSPVTVCKGKNVLGLFLTAAVGHPQKMELWN